MIGMVELRVVGHLGRLGRREEAVDRGCEDERSIARMRLQDALREGVVRVVVLVQMLRAGAEATMEYQRLVT